jgi:hypothetical protein
VRENEMPITTLSSREFNQDTSGATAGGGRPSGPGSKGQDRGAFGGRILPVDAVVAIRGAGLHPPDPRSERDALIAATALTHGMTVVTRNTADFEATGVALLNPWRT